MINISDSKITKEEEKEIKEFVSILFLPFRNCVPSE